MKVKSLNSKSADISVRPYNESESKKSQVEKMFDNISGRYDFLNHFLSFGIDRGWRRKAIAELRDYRGGRFLDVATGTADLAIGALKHSPSEVVGVDLSEKMLEVGREKIKKAKIQNIRLEKGDSENLHFEDNEFDVSMAAFGVRNFENLEKGLSEMFRVIKPGGKLVVLEFSNPRSFPFKQMYNLYGKVFLPLWGRIFAGDKDAYTYLPESVKRFPDGVKFLNVLENIGYKNTNQRRLTFGICSIYTANK